MISFKGNNPSGFKILLNKPLATSALKHYFSWALTAPNTPQPCFFQLQSCGMAQWVTWHSENTWLKSVKIRNMYSMLSFISELRLCLTRHRPADHPALWFCNDHVNQCQQEALQVRCLHVPGRAGGTCGSVLFCLVSVNKLVCWWWNLPGRGWGTGRYLQQRAFCSLRSFMAVLYAENLTLFRSAVGRQDQNKRSASHTRNNQTHEYVVMLNYKTIPVG